MTLLYIILATTLVSAVAFIGIISLAFSKALLDRLLLCLVALAAGGLMGGAFFHLIPEALHGLEELGKGHEGASLLFVFVVIGFCLFFLIEQFLHWHHHHHTNHDCKACDYKKKKPLAYLILIGDGVHNFIDGIVIAASFVVSPFAGIVTTIAVALHEIPQEIGDFGVLVHSGFSRSKALLFNFLSALTAVFGGVVGYLFMGQLEGVIVYVLPLAAGGFLYLAASDLIPEIKHGDKTVRMIANFGCFLFGIAIMYGLTLIEAGH
jgi:zinc and cadmium transporter